MMADQSAASLKRGTLTAGLIAGFRHRVPDRNHQPAVLTFAPRRRIRLHLDDYDNLLASLYRGPLEDPPWQGFLGLLCRTMQAFAVSLVLRPPASGDAGLILNYQAQQGGIADPADWPAAAYREQFFALDPFVNLPPGEVFTMAELVPEDQLRTSEYYRHYLEPAGILHIIGFDTIEPDGFQARLRACRSIDTAAFNATDKSLMARLVKHLRQAIQLHARLNRIESERDLYAGAFDRLSVATVILDEQGEVIHTNDVADALLAERDGISLGARQLHFTRREDGDEFRRLREPFLKQGIESSGPALTVAMRIQRPSGKPDLGLVIKPVPSSEWSEGQAWPRAAVFISDPQRQTDTSQQLIQRLFGFTPAESALTMRLIRGLSVVEAAAELGVSPHTARAQLKAVFAKTGVTRQAELVRLVIKSVANLG